MKYIDANKLKAEIERLYYNEAEKDESILAADAYKNALDAVEKFLDSPQQEQQKSKKDCNGCPHCVDRKDQYGWHFKGCFGGPYNGKFIAEIDECPLKQKPAECSEDERMVKAIEYILYENYSDAAVVEGVEIAEIVTWLEKQKEQKPVDLVAELKLHLANTPKEQLEKEWKELEPWSKIGPTVQEFLYGKQSEVDLEEAITEYYGNIPEDKDKVDAARHGYELGLKAKGE